MNKKFNLPDNYNNRDFEFGFREDKIPTAAVFAAREGEKVLQTVLPYNGTPVEELEKTFDEIDFAMIEEIGRSKYLTSLQIYQYVGLRGLVVQRTGVRKRLNKMMKLRAIREYEIKSADSATGLKAYDLDFKGYQIALSRGVLFNRGNRYLSGYKKQLSGEYDSAEDIKRILTANMVILGLMMNNADLSRFGIMETMRPSQDLVITDGCIIRTAANVVIDDDSMLLYEVVRSTPHAMRKLADKVARYYTLVNDQRYQQDNYYGYKALPQLVICGESYEHNRKIDQYLRSRDLIREEDGLLYTEDLLYVQSTLQNLYELDDNGRQTWYRLPEKQHAFDMERSA